MEWIEVKNDEDIQRINETYNYFEDAVLVKMEYVSGDYVDDSMTETLMQKNDLKLIFQRLDKAPFSIELWFTNTKRINMFFVNPQDNLLSDLLFAKVCRNEKALFWTVWEEFDPFNENHLKRSDVGYIEAYGLKWRISE